MLGVIGTWYMISRSGVSKQKLDFQLKIIQFLGIFHQKSGFK